MEPGQSCLQVEEVEIDMVQEVDVEGEVDMVVVEEEAGTAVVEWVCVHDGQLVQILGGVVGVRCLCRSKRHMIGLEMTSAMTKCGKEGVGCFDAVWDIGLYILG